MRLLLAPLLLSGCFAMDYTSHERLITAARDYTEGVRWGRLENASSHIMADQKARFYERHKAVEDELEFAESDVINVVIDRSDKKKLKAIANVQYTWTYKRRGILEKTITLQRWEEIGSTWILKSEERARGAKNILFDEPKQAAREVSLAR